MSKVGTGFGTGTVKNSYGSETLVGRSYGSTLPGRPFPGFGCPAAGPASMCRSPRPDLSPHRAASAAAATSPAAATRAASNPAAAWGAATDRAAAACGAAIDRAAAWCAATDRAAARGAEKGCAAVCGGGEGSGYDGGAGGEWKEAATRSRAVVRRPAASGHCR